MAKKDETNPTTPNRDAYKQAFTEDYPDMDFEDKEGRYGRMLEDRKALRSYKESGARLNDTLMKNRWIASMLQEISENPNLDPWQWMAQNGIDFNEAMQDPEYSQKIGGIIADYQQRQMDNEQENAQMGENFRRSAEALTRATGLEGDQALTLWTQLYDIVEMALRGEVSEDTWRLIQRANTYDADMQSAREQSAMQARNEKIANKVKTFDEELPPSLPQAGQQTTARPQKKRGGFFDDLKDAGY